MIDLDSIATLFVHGRGMAPWARRFDALSDVEHEKAYLDLKAAGHAFQWAPETRLRQLKSEGWAPVFERDTTGRPTIFTDRKKELVLLHRPPSTAA